jgi:hypothetical protein
MAFANSSTTTNQFQLVTTIKSILVWSFVLTVCMLVIGFPILMLMVAVGSLTAVTLHAIMPTSAMLMTAIGFIGAHILGILAASSFLTLKGIHPHEVESLRWLNGQANPVTISTYASCPLTCDLKG